MNDNSLAHRYLDLLKKSLLNELYIENEARLIQILGHILNSDRCVTFQDAHEVPDWLLATLRAIKQNGSTLVLNLNKSDGSTVAIPSMRNYTELSHSMVGMKRLNNIQYCMETVMSEAIPGDMLEAGIWRGGAVIFMRGILAAYGITDRCVWAADSFQGVPEPTLPQDANFDLSARLFPVLAVKYEQVRELFERYGLLDDQVKFLQGWFKDTLGTAPIERLACLRLDGDLYESTINTLKPLYAKVASGGFIIVDDYSSCPPCQHAVDEFRADHGITDPISQIDDQGVFWRKS